MQLYVSDGVDVINNSLILCTLAYASVRSESRMSCIHLKTSSTYISHCNYNIELIQLIWIQLQQKQGISKSSPGGGFTVTNALTLRSTGTGVLPAVSSVTRLVPIPNVAGSVGGGTPGGVFRGHQNTQSDLLW